MDDSKKGFKEIVNDRLADVEDFCGEHCMTIIVAGGLTMLSVIAVVMTKDYNQYLRNLETMVSYSLK